jgi:Tfp pilus assembly protein PilO
MSALWQSFLILSRRRPLVVVCFALSAALIVANYFLWQQRREITRRHDEVRRQGEEMRNALTNHSRINAELATVNEAVSFIDRNLVVEGNMEVNLGYFYRMERLSRVRLTSLNQLGSPPPPEDNPFRAIPFSLQAAGSYSQIVHFLRELETGPRLLRIRSYSFSRGDTKTNAMTLDVTAELLGRQ